MLDAFEKLEEFNVRYGLNFRMGLAKMWLPRGQKFDKTRVYLCSMNAMLDMLGYHYAQCRVLTLGNFTTTDEVKRNGVAIDVDHHGDRMFIADEY